MAKARVSTNPLYNGGAGGYTFYTRDGEQIIRQRKNNSNYGESASRSEAQQLRRVRWSNLVNLYKAMKSWQPKAYESKRPGQTDYNIFMSLNINSSVVGLTKSMALQGCAVVEPLMVSRGSLPKIGRAGLASSGAFDTDIVLSQAITPTTTIAELSADIIANNPQWLDGDNLAMALYIQTGGDGVDPYVACRYTELTLDATNTALLSTLSYGSRLTRIQSGTQGAYYLNFTYDLTANEVGIAFIHTRKVSGGLQVSNSQIQLNGDYIWDEYSGQQWLLQCAASYGIDQEVPLDPSFPDGFISSVTANGAVISSGAVLRGSQLLRVRGSGAASSDVKLYRDGVFLAKLSTGDNYSDYVLTASGAYSLYIGSNLYITFRITGAARPSILTGRVYAQQLQSGGTTVTTGVNQEITTADCLQYPYKVTEEYPLFKVVANSQSGEVPDVDDVTCGNCSVTDSAIEEGALLLVVSVTDSSLPAYVMYDGFIIFVGNYSE